MNIISKFKDEYKLIGLLSIKPTVIFTIMMFILLLYSSVLNLILITLIKLFTGNKIIIYCTMFMTCAISFYPILCIFKVIIFKTDNLYNKIFNKILYKKHYLTYEKYEQNINNIEKADKRIKQYIFTSQYRNNENLTNKLIELQNIYNEFNDFIIDKANKSANNNFLELNTFIENNINLFNEKLEKLNNEYNLEYK